MRYAFGSFILSALSVGCALLAGIGIAMLCESIERLKYGWPSNSTKILLEKDIMRYKIVFIVLFALSIVFLVGAFYLGYLGAKDYITVSLP